MNDEQLLGALRSDPQKGLEAVVRQYSGYVLKIARVKLGDVCTREDIEEAVSDIFLKFYKAGSERGFELRSVRGLLSVIAARHCTDIFRVKKNAVETVGFDELENLIAEDKDMNVPDLAAAVKSLGEPDSFIFIRKYWFGQKNADIARELGMSPGALNTRVSRGLDKLRKILEGTL